MSNRTIVIYKSKTGFTEQYAQWIRDELGCEIARYEDRNHINLEDYDTLIFGGGFYAGKIAGLKWFLEQALVLDSRKVVVFGTGASPAGFP